MRDADQWNTAAQRLTILTERGSLKWIDNLWPLEIREAVVGDAVYGATFKNKFLMVYEYSYRAYSDEDNFEWAKDVAIEFVDHQGNLQWQWPKVPYRIRLLDAIRCKVSGATDFLESLLAEDIPDDES